MTSEYQIKNSLLNSNINNQFQLKNTNSNFSELQENINQGIIHNKKPEHKKNSMIITEAKNDSVINIEKIKKINYHFGKLTYTLFCSCTQIAKNLNDEYKKVVLELQNYTDIIKLSFNLFDLEKIKEIIIEAGISENWVSKSKIVYINEFTNESFNKNHYNSNANLLGENILNKNNIISKSRNVESNKIRTVSLFKKMKDNENQHKKIINEKDNYLSEINFADENENQAKNNNNNKIKIKHNKNNNSVISSLNKEL